MIKISYAFELSSSLGAHVPKILGIEHVAMDVRSFKNYNTGSPSTTAFDLRPSQYGDALPQNQCEIFFPTLDDEFIVSVDSRETVGTTVAHLVRPSIIDCKASDSIFGFGYVPPADVASPDSKLVLNVYTSDIELLLGPNKIGGFVRHTADGKIRPNKDTFLGSFNLTLDPYFHGRSGAGIVCSFINPWSKSTCTTISTNSIAEELRCKTSQPYTNTLVSQPIGPAGVHDLHPPVLVGLDAAHIQSAFLLHSNINRIVQAAVDEVKKGVSYVVR